MSSAPLDLHSAWWCGSTLCGLTLPPNHWPYAWYRLLLTGWQVRVVVRHGWLCAGLRGEESFPGAGQGGACRQATHAQGSGRDLCLPSSHVHNAINFVALAPVQLVLVVLVRGNSGGWEEVNAHRILPGLTFLVSSLSWRIQLEASLTS